MKKLLAICGIVLTSIIVSGCQQKSQNANQQEQRCISNQCVIELCIQKKESRCKSIETTTENNLSLDQKVEALQKAYPNYFCRSLVIPPGNEEMLDCKLVEDEN